MTEAKKIFLKNIDLIRYKRSMGGKKPLLGKDKTICGRGSVQPIWYFVLR